MEGTNSRVRVNLAWVRECWRAVVGAVQDHEGFVASDRARLLRMAIGSLATLCVWAAWAWLVVSVLYVAVTPVDVAEAVTAAEQLGHRDALFFVLALALVGPLVVAAAAWLLLFAYRIALDQLTRRLPRAFHPLAAPAIVVAALAVQWSNRGLLHGEFWRLYRRVGEVLHAAGQFTPVVQ